MSFKTNRAITLSDGDEDKFPRQLAPVVLPGGKQPGGSLPDPPALQEVNHRGSRGGSGGNPSPLGKSSIFISNLTTYRI